MSLGERFFAAIYDRAFSTMENAGLRDMRASIVGQASGRVLELGAGTGLNLAHYTPAVESLVLTEPAEPMARRLRRKLADSGREAQVIETGAERLPVEDESVDTVVSTLVLCTVPSVEDSLAEVRRVLVPGGRLLFLEHVRHSDPRRARNQDRFNPIQNRIAQGCHCNRATPKLIADAGFKLVDVVSARLPRAYPVIRPLAMGSATRP